ncbi:hypothetical protein [Prosthecobacter sp.]|uniref:hypothetical protein n=1 Tax=Prosthecobacter sp. TaxID=1965333 RepID=UPI00378315E3
MARRKESFLSMLVHGIPWWVSASLAAVVYVMMRWVAPDIRLDDPTIAHFIKSMPDVAWLGASPLLLLAGLNLYVTFFKKRAKSGSDC